MQTYSPRDPLGEYLQGTITFRQLRVMVEQLARDTSTPIGRAINGPWGDHERLLHSIEWQLQRLHASYYNTNRDKGKALLEPEPLAQPEPTTYQALAERQRTAPDVQQVAVEQGLLAVLSRTQETT